MFHNRGLYRLQHFNCATQAEIMLLLKSLIVTIFVTFQATLEVSAAGCPVPACASCTKNFKCLSCKNGYFLTTSSECQACPFNCASCTASGCNSCSSGYGINSTSKQCESCPSTCATCRDNKCTSCYNGSYVARNGYCAPCTNNCQYCTASGCISCNGGFGMSPISGKCGSCAPYCSECKYASTCSPNSCFQGYKYNAFTQQCDACSSSCSHCPFGNTCYEGLCPPQTTFNALALNCTKCQTNCDYCYNNGTCFPNSCTSGYTFDWTTNTCTTRTATCPFKCNNCLNATTCLPNECQSGSVFNEITGLCDPCADKCQRCLSAGTCLTDACLTSYVYDSTSQVCKACSSSCRYCTVANTCDPNGCNEQYEYNSTTQACDPLISCSANCRNCSIAGTCNPDGCNTPFEYNSTTQRCDIQRICAPNCYSCASSNTCSPNTCYEGYAFNETSQTCLLCSDATCLKCASPNKCLPNGCNKGFAFDEETETCLPCADNCDFCISNGTCVPEGCRSGYTYVFGDYLSPCMPCPEEKGAVCQSSVCNTYRQYAGRFTYDADTQKCVACDQFCNYCSINNGTCLPNACQTRYAFNLTSQACEPCATNCYSCSSPGTCSPNSCYSRNAFDVASQKCLPCAPYCNSCSLPETCSPTSCFSGYAFDSVSQKCLWCTSSCSKCNIPGTCLPTACARGTTYNATTKKCDACSKNCATCKTANTCLPTGCNSYFTYNATSQACEGCIPRCPSCNASNTCVIGGCFGYYIYLYDNLYYDRYYYKQYVYDITTNSCDACALYCDGCQVKGTCLPSKCHTPYYTYDAQTQTCKVASPCNYVKDICNYRGECTNTSSYPYYACNCYKGFGGPRCTEILNAPLYPHGSTTKDNILQNTDDGSTPRILFDQSFLFYGRFLTSAFINMNGFISFSINYLSYRPMLFPHDNSEDADLLAPFWADADSSGLYCDCTTGCSSCGTNVVYYHIYKTDTSKKYPLNSTESVVFGLATADGRTYVPGFKKADWVMVVTWSHLTPYPSSANKNSLEKNKFQAVLAMDSKRLKSFVSFRYGENQWNPIRPAMMGVQAIKSNFYFNFGNPYILSAVSGSGVTPSYEVGIAMFDTTGSSSPTPGLKCLDWVATEEDSDPSVFADIGSLPPCPCSGFQAMFSPSHVFIPGTDCFVTTSTNFNGIAMKCCYDRNVWMWSYHWIQWSWMWTGVWLGNLIVDPIYEAGGFYEKNPLYNSYAAVSSEDKAKQDCCLYSANCPAYYRVRPINTCEGFISTLVRSSYGDPHITTFDGQSYDYNGIGEYWLIRSPFLHMQVRTVQARDVNNKLVSASVFGAYAIQVPQDADQIASDRLFLQMVNSGQNFELYVLPQTNDQNPALVNLTDWARNGTNVSSSDDIIATYNGFVLKRLGAVKGVIVNIAKGTLLIFRLEAGQLSITMTAGKALYNTTRGLFGTYDDNMKNDFTLRNGSVVAATSNSQVLYSTFGESWRITASESLMVYEAGKSFSHYQNTSFTPMFTPKFSSTAAQRTAESLCGTNAQCLLDFAATGDAKMASVTLTNTDRINNVNKIFKSSQPVIKGPQQLRITVGKKFTATYTTFNADKSSVTLSMSGSPTGATFNPTTGVFTWTPSKMIPVVNLSVDAISSSGFPARSISIAVLMCSGCGNHGSCDFNETTPSYRLTYRYQVVTCTCFDGYRGENCNVTDNYCANQPCGENATCVSLPPGQLNEFGLTYNCTKCPPEQRLSRGKCVDDIVKMIDDENKDIGQVCSSMPCQNKGTCEASSSGYICTCPFDFSGLNCESYVLPFSNSACSSMPCQNNATCQPAPSSYICACPPDFGGINCEKSLTTTTTKSSTRTTTQSTTTKKRTTPRTTLTTTTVKTTTECNQFYYRLFGRC